MVQSPCVATSHISSICHADQMPRYGSPQQHRKFIGEFYLPSWLELQQGLSGCSNPILIACAYDKIRGINKKGNIYFGTLILKVSLRWSRITSAPAFGCQADVTSLYCLLYSHVDFSCLLSQQPANFRGRG